MTASINAVATTTRVNDWLNSSSSPRILHVFDRVCSLVNEKREVVSIVTPEIGNGPFNMVIKNHLSFPDLLSRESLVYNAPSELQIGNISIQTRSSNLWNAQPDWATLHTRRHAILQQFKTLLSIQSPVSNTCTERKYRCLQFSNSLSSSLAIADIPSSISSAKNLAGLGQGLTPSGDDYLMGAMYAAWIVHPQGVAKRIAYEIANTTAPLTTTLSGAWLRAAGNGEAGILWHAFLESLVVGEQDVIKDTVNNILAVGATSGADAMAGFISTLIAFTEIEKKYVIS